MSREGSQKAVFEARAGASNLVGCPPSEVRVDMPVETVFEDVSPDWTLAKFRPA
jgi:hypothetical protein